MRPLDIILSARDAINDCDVSAYRQSNDELLRYVNDGLRECAVLAPQLFFVTGDMECEANSTEQAISFADAQALADVLRVKGGRTVSPCDMSALSAFNPRWANEAEAEAVHFMRVEGDPLRFYIYPPAPRGQVLEIKYVKVPRSVALHEVITELPVTMQPALTDYVVHRAEYKDDEHVNSGRAMNHYQKFVASLKGG